MAPELPNPAMLATDIDGLVPQQGFSMARYGYAVLHGSAHHPGVLELDFRGVDGEAVATVLLA